MKLSDLPNWLVESDIDLRKLKQKSESNPIEAIKANVEVVEAIKSIREERKPVKKKKKRKKSSKKCHQKKILRKPRKKNM